MAICPKCNKEIDELIYYSKVEVSQNCRLDNKGNMEYDAFDDPGEHSDEEYACPYCNEALAGTEVNAIKILKSSKKTGPRYVVRLKKEKYVDVTVKAKSKKEAEDKAIEGDYDEDQVIEDEFLLPSSEWTVINVEKKR